MGVLPHYRRKADVASDKLQSRGFSIVLLSRAAQEYAAQRHNASFSTKAPRLLFSEVKDKGFWVDCQVQTGWRSPEVLYLRSFIRK
jgi:hypothetical protein